MIGVSLTPELLASSSASRADRQLLEVYGSTASILAELKKLGVSSIELRAIKPRNYAMVTSAIKAVVDAGLSYTVHGTLPAEGDPIQAVLEPLYEAFECGLIKDRLIITLHPIAVGTVEAVRAICAEAESRGMNIAIALENNRKRPDGEPGDTCDFVYELVSEIGLTNVGVCFDMGHFYHNVKLYMDGVETCLPPRKFMKAVIHTHIHSVEDMSTHYPLDRGELPLKYYCDSLGANVCYNLELSATRYFEKYDQIESLVESVKTLRSAIPTIAVAREMLESSVGEVWEKGLSLPEDHFTLLGPSGYLFNFGGKVVAVDPSIRNKSLIAPLSETISRYADKVDFILLTHEHNDHYVPEILKMMVGENTKLLVPDFFDDERLASVADSSHIIRVSDRDMVVICGLRVDCFRSQHFREDGTGTNEFGYYITEPNGRTLLMCCDVRNYDADLLSKDLRGADRVIAHVWLGDKVCLDKDYLDPMNHMVRRFADFYATMLGDNPNATLYLSHLLESGRDMTTMWSYVHAGALMDALYVRKPSVDCVIPRMGRYYSL